MAKANKKTREKPAAVSVRADPRRLAKLFVLPRHNANKQNLRQPFSKTHQPKGKRGRPPGLENLLTREIKEAAVTAAKMYGVDGSIEQEVEARRRASGIQPDAPVPFICTADHPWKPGLEGKGRVVRV